MGVQLPTFRGRTLGIAAVTALQILIGGIHIFFGFVLLASIQMQVGFLKTPGVVYDIYTITFGFAASIFAFGIWSRKLWGKLGTIVMSLFVTVADLLTLLDLPSVPGIPKSAAFPEILYSVFIIFYLLQARQKPSEGL